MSDPAKTIDQNILPVQALFNLDNTFNTFIGQGQPFTASISPNQSGLHITSSTIDSTTIGATTPSTAAFTTATASNAPVGANDLTNKYYVDALTLGLSFKQPALCATTANITLSGLQTIDGITVAAGDRVLVKNQSTQANNGIYLASTGAWSRSPDADAYSELVSAFLFVESGSTQAGTAFYCTSQPGGTLGVTAITWSNFALSSSYTAGTGLTLAANQFSITNTGVSANTYGSASSVPVVAVNAQGQITSATNTSIAIANTQVSGLGTMSTQNANNVAITGGSIAGTPISGSTVGGTTITASTQFSGPGTGLTGTASGLSIGGNAATATSATTAGSATTATTATNLAGGAAGSVPYQSASSTTAMLGIGSSGQVLSVNAGLPAWTSVSGVAVTSFSAGTTGFTPSSATNGAVTLAGTLNTGNGGTGLTTFTSGGAVYATSTSALTTGTLPVASGGTGVTSSTGSGNVVLSTSPTLVTPVLGTPTSVTLTNGTGLPLTTGVTGVLPIANGGTNATATPTAGAVPYGTGTAYAFTSAGTAGQVLTSNGSGAPTWSSPTSGMTIQDDTTTSSARYPLFSSATSGTVTTEYTSSTKYQFVPSTGTLSATVFSGSGASLTSIPNSALNNSSVTVGSTAISLGGTATTIAGLSSVTSTTFVGDLSGNASTATTAGNVTGTVAVANGGTGLTSTPANGALDIGNGTGFTRTTLTAGSGVSITNGSGSITIASTGGSAPIKTDLTKYDNIITPSSVLGTSFLGQIAVKVTSTTELLILIGNASAHAVIWDNTNKVFGTPILVRTAVFTSTVNVAAINISSTTVLMCSSVGTALETVVLSVSGTTITVNTAVATTLGTFNNFSTGTTVNNGVGRLIQVGSSYVLNYAGASSFPAFRAITVSGTTPTIGSELTFTGGTNPVNFSNFVISSSVFVSISTTATTLYAVPISVSGTTLTQGTQATTTVTTTNYVAGLLTSNNIAISFLNTNGYAGVVSVVATIATISLGSSTGLSNWSPYMQVIGSQAYVVSSVSNQNYIALLTDTAGVASLQTPVGSPDGVTTQWYLVGASASKVFLQRQATTNTFYTYSISSNSAVLSSVYPFTLLVNATGYTTSLASYSLIYANVENSANLVTSTYKTVPLNTSSNFFTASFDGTGSASYQQAVGFSNNTSNRSSLNLYSGWLGYLYYTAAGGSATQSTVYMRRVELA